MTVPDVSGDWIATESALRDWLTPAGGQRLLALDTEFIRRDTFYAQLALLQLGYRDQAALVDPTAFNIGNQLAEHLQLHATVVVMHSASEDLEVLTPLLPDGPPELFDTQIAASLSGIGFNLSYRALVHSIAGVELDKGETRSDWLQRPLTDSQRRYATLDVTYLEPIHDHLQARLQSLQRRDWLREECERLKRRTTQRVDDSQPQRQCKPAADWDRPQQALLRRLLLWRDHTARSIDKPRSWLFDDPLALELAAEPPRSLDELQQRARGQRALRSQQRAALFEVIAQPVSDAEIAATAPVLGLPQGKHKQALTRMKQVVDQAAAELDLPAGLLCPRKTLEDYVMTAQLPELLEGWRQPILATGLANALP